LRAFTAEDIDNMLAIRHHTVMQARTAHVALYDGFIDSEVGHLLVELRTGRFTREAFRIVTVAESLDPITTAGGFRVLPDRPLEDLDGAQSDVLVLAGAEMWDAGGGQVFAAAAGAFLARGVPVAAICGATAGLARAGLLDDRRHTSSAAAYLAATGYGGGALYAEDRAVTDRGLITAGPQSPVQFARATLDALGLAPEPKLDSYERLFHEADLSAFAALFPAGDGP
jgi:putative intracellular protease/amidase